VRAVIINNVLHSARRNAGPDSVFDDRARSVADARAEQTARVRIARDERRHLRQLCQTVDALEAERLLPATARSTPLRRGRGCGSVPSTD
jgi:hypothetical protein